MHECTCDARVEICMLVGALVNIGIVSGIIAVDVPAVFLMDTYMYMHAHVYTGSCCAGLREIVAMYISRSLVVYFLRYGGMEQIVCSQVLVV